MSHPQWKRKKKGQKAPKAAKTVDDMTQWSQAWGVGPTETNMPGTEKKVLHPPEMKQHSHTCFQFPANWNSVRNNGCLCDKESERKKNGKKQDDICNMCVSVSAFPCFISSILESSFQKHIKTMPWTNCSSCLSYAGVLFMFSIYIRQPF